MSSHPKHLNSFLGPNPLGVQNHISLLTTMGEFHLVPCKANDKTRDNEQGQLNWRETTKSKRSGSSVYISPCWVVHTISWACLEGVLEALSQGSPIWRKPTMGKSWEPGTPGGGLPPLVTVTGNPPEGEGLLPLTLPVTWGKWNHGTECADFFCLVCLNFPFQPCPDTFARILDRC